MNNTMAELQLLSRIENKFVVSNKFATYSMKNIVKVAGMSLEILEQLEAKVQMAVDTIALLQMEVEELKETNAALTQDLEQANNGRSEVEQEAQRARDEQAQFEARIRGLLGKMDEVE
ncbi:hypothetical protein AFI02nite_31330 [Aliivibrio fischeri]|nr:hypothetical protein AFI02nite_31330 [Aliivibrio fischeri]GGK46629.1 hypothetical protein GCM10007987_32290 [Aliivibrio fischeri]